MLLEAAETVLGWDFDRTLYGDAPKTKNRKWWRRFSEERLRDRGNEPI
jgi:hypothetical protein